ncbi:nuA4 complex subunit EAF3 homolog [Drosophila guanche]|uniref:Blast:NuA4 complex subunit EAF3 homolog n=1 Tax=Drosophila guanche TaxID=7266 RepID=A0A3B0JNW5_DROGU|nr:nuA4 complex subunit EAF3 homolog [Drosophila guanche]SPP83924.1 blast:NuA4 complex subunit EAF3 homolog [Drosophila guanche]
MEIVGSAADAASMFADGERVLCFHGPLIYEAKVLKTKPDATPVEYYIHYAGWSKNWDEWVPESRVLKYNDDNVQRQKEQARLCGERSKKDNKKGSAKAKKMEQVGNDSRASTPSKEGNTSLPLVVSTPTSSMGPMSKSDSGSNSSITPNSISANTSTSRANRKSTHSAIVSARPGTPNEKKEDASSAEITEEDGAAAVPPKKKRISEQRPSLSGSDTTASAEKQGTPAAPTPTPTTPTPPSEPAPCVESEESFTNKLEVKIKIPDELKHYLTDDWYAVVREHKLLELPAKVTIQEIAEQYLAYKKSVKSTSASKEVAINDVLEGIVEYFNVMLGSQLLYKFERTQYADVMQKHPETPLSDLYGSFHLLRLFVRLGSMLTYSALDQQAMQNLIVHLQDFLKFLVKNSALYFSMNNFVNVDPEYVRNAQ